MLSTTDSLFRALHLLFCRAHCPFRTGKLLLSHQSPSSNGPSFEMDSSLVHHPAVGISRKGVEREAPPWDREGSSFVPQGSPAQQSPSPRRRVTEPPRVSQQGEGRTAWFWRSGAPASVARPFRGAEEPLRARGQGAPPGRGSGAARGRRKRGPQESGASRPYKDMCAGGQSAAGAWRPAPRVPRRRPGPARPVPSRPAAPPAMSSTQFNKGPSYGLSAEVKNRVSEGRAPVPAGRGRDPRQAPQREPREESGPLPPNVWCAGGIFPEAPSTPGERSGLRSGTPNIEGRLGLTPSSSPAASEPPPSLAAPQPAAPPALPGLENALRA